MSRNKENTPAKFQRRVSTSNVGLTATQNSDEFFTDSILESDATRTSKIPTPKPQKTIQTKSRRSRRSMKTNTREAESEPKEAGLQPAINIRRTKSPSPPRNIVASTPPQTRVRTDIPGPSTEIQSPPPQEFTDVYRQIADEEDLAATERESSSSDDGLSDQSHKLKSNVVDYFNPGHRGNRSRSSASHTSRSSTPTHDQRRRQLNMTNPPNAQQEPETSHSGMSFLNDITDQALAAKLTPHVSESAKDRARLREVWSNQKPVAFTKVSRSRAIENNIADDLVSTNGAKTFRKSMHSGIPDIDVDQVSRSASRHSDGSLEEYASRFNAWENFDQPLKDLPTNSRVERNFHFSRRHGFPQSRPALTEQNLEQQNRGIGHKPYIQSSLGSPMSRHSDPVTGNLRNPSIRQDSINEYSARAQKIRESIADLVQSEILPPPKKEQQRQFIGPVVDWTSTAADVRSSSREGGPLLSDKDHLPGPEEERISPEKSRRLDIDFTGQSFQVSESPPVRNRPTRNDRSLGKEMENLNKRAVTTSRLGEIRERQSLEQLRRQSRSPGPRETSISSSGKDHKHNTENEGREHIGEPVPDTPVVIFRSSSTGSSDKKTIAQDITSKSNSDEYLQRFARALSNTPRSSPASTIAPPGDHGAADNISKPTNNRESVNQESLPDKKPVVAATPKVTGAWTDTILPDTVKTIKPPGAQGKIMQTPHVSAGGWIDTPFQDGQKKSIEMTPILEEIPEELVHGIARGRSEHEAGPLRAVGRSIAEGPVEMPKAGLAGILDRAKQRLISQDITSAARGNDTLNLGNETIESLQDLLTLDATEFTVLSKVFNEEDEAAGSEGIEAEGIILERIGAKLDRLRSNIHEARKGISQLEHKVSQPETAQLQDHSTSVMTVCTSCNQSMYTTSPYPQSGSLPVAPLHITLPIPLLFHLDSAASGTSKGSFFGFRLLRPTPLGWFTLALWLWYVTECTLSEIYSHPTHAEYYSWPSPHQAEPEFPYVLPTMLSRWLRLDNLFSVAQVFLGWLGTFLRAASRIVSMWIGWTDGFMDPAARKKVVQALTSTTSAAIGVETDMSMMNDEFI